MTADLRALLDAATPGPWDKLTYGNASTAKVAGRMADSAYRTARKAGVPMTDLTEIGAPNGKIVAYTGNGPTSPENAALIVALVNAAPALLDVVEAAEDPGGGWHDCSCSWHARLRYALRRLKETR